MRNYEVKCRLRGTITYEPWNAPMQGSGIYAEEAETEQDVEMLIGARNEGRARELIEGYRFEKENGWCGWTYESIEILTIKEVDEDCSEDEFVEVWDIDEIDIDSYIYGYDSD